MIELILFLILGTSNAAIAYPEGSNIPWEQKSPEQRAEYCSYCMLKGVQPLCYNWNVTCKEYLGTCYE